jgi:hypothetical protein
MCPGQDPPHQANKIKRLERFTGEDARSETGHHRRVLRPRVGRGSLPSETEAAPAARTKDRVSGRREDHSRVEHGPRDAERPAIDRSATPQGGQDAAVRM